MAIKIGNQGTITASTNITIDSAKQQQVVSYSFSVFTDGGICNDTFDATVYSLSEVLGIGSSLFQNIELTIPTTYSAVSNPNESGQNYFILTGNTITSQGACD